MKIKSQCARHAGYADTTYRRITGDGVRTRQALGRAFLEVDPEALTQLTAAAIRDIQHLLRLAHLRSVLDDLQASPNDRCVACDLPQNACIAAAGPCRCARTPAPRS